MTTTPSGAAAAAPHRMYLYARNSKGKKVSIAQQVALAEGYATDEGLDATIPYLDKRSAWRGSSRPLAGFPQLLEDIASARPGDVLWVWEVARGSRDAHAWGGLVKQCEAVGGRVHGQDDERLYDPRKNGHWKHLQMEGIHAEAASRDTSARVNRSVPGHAKEGKPYGWMPYGYRREYSFDASGNREVKQL